MENENKGNWANRKMGNWNNQMENEKGETGNGKYQIPAMSKWKHREWNNKTRNNK